MKNPYPNRPYSVGKLEYKLKKGQESVDKIKCLAMLEYGEAELIYDLPRLVGGGKIANLGHAGGGSAILMAQSLRDNDLKGMVVSVDVFKDDKRYERAVSNLIKFGAYARINIIRAKTNEAFEAARDMTFNLIFVDADHSYEGVKADFLNWSTLLARGGCIAFHDTNQEFSHQVLEEYLIDKPEWQEYKNLHVNRIRVFEKL